MKTQRHRGAAMNPTSKKKTSAKNVIKSVLDKNTKISTDLTGKYVRVYWPLEVEWFRGRVTEYDSDKGIHCVAYDDGDVYWHDLHKSQTEVVHAQPSFAASKKGIHNKRKVEPQRRACKRASRKPSEIHTRTTERRMQKGRTTLVSRRIQAEISRLPGGGAVDVVSRPTRSCTAKRRNNLRTVQRQPNSHIAPDTKDAQRTPDTDSTPKWEFSELVDDIVFEHANLPSALIKQRRVLDGKSCASHRKGDIRTRASRYGVVRTQSSRGCISASGCYSSRESRATPPNPNHEVVNIDVTQLPVRSDARSPRASAGVAHSTLSNPRADAVALRVHSPNARQPSPAPVSRFCVNRPITKHIKGSGTGLVADDGSVAESILKRCECTSSDGESNICIHDGIFPIIANRYGKTATTDSAGNGSNENDTFVYTGRLCDREPHSSTTGANVKLPPTTEPLETYSDGEPDSTFPDVDTQLPPTTKPLNAWCNGEPDPSAPANTDTKLFPTTEPRNIAVDRVEEASDNCRSFPLVPGLQYVKSKQNYTKETSRSKKRRHGSHATGKRRRKTPGSYTMPPSSRSILQQVLMYAQGSYQWGFCPTTDHLGYGVRQQYDPNTLCEIQSDNSSHTWLCNYPGSDPNQMPIDTRQARDGVKNVHMSTQQHVPQQITVSCAGGRGDIQRTTLEMYPEETSFPQSAQCAGEQASRRMEARVGNSVLTLLSPRDVISVESGNKFSLPELRKIFLDLLHQST